MTHLRAGSGKAFNADYRTAALAGAGHRPAAAFSRLAKLLDVHGAFEAISASKSLARPLGDELLDAFVAAIAERVATANGRLSYREAVWQVLPKEADQKLSPALLQTLHELFLDIAEPERFDDGDGDDELEATIVQKSTRATGLPRSVFYTEARTVMADILGAYDDDESDWIRDERYNRINSWLGVAGRYTHDIAYQIREQTAKEAATNAGTTLKRARLQAAKAIPATVLILAFIGALTGNQLDTACQHGMTGIIKSYIVDFAEAAGHVLHATLYRPVAVDGGTDDDIADDDSSTDSASDAEAPGAASTIHSATYASSLPSTCVTAESRAVWARLTTAGARVAAFLNNVKTQLTAAGWNAGVPQQLDTPRCAQCPPEFTDGVRLADLLRAIYSDAYLESVVALRCAARARDLAIDAVANAGGFSRKSDDDDKDEQPASASRPVSKTARAAHNRMHAMAQERETRKASASASEALTLEALSIYASRLITHVQACIRPSSAATFSAPRTATLPPNVHVAYLRLLTATSRGQGGQVAPRDLLTATSALVDAVCLAGDTRAAWMPLSHACSARTPLSTRVLNAAALLPMPTVHEDDAPCDINLLCAPGTAVRVAESLRGSLTEPVNLQLFPWEVAGALGQSATATYARVVQRSMSGKQTVPRSMPVTTLECAAPLRFRALMSVTSAYLVANRDAIAQWTLHLPSSTLEGIIGELRAMYTNSQAPRTMGWQPCIHPSPLLPALIAIGSCTQDAAAGRLSVSEAAAIPTYMGLVLHALDGAAANIGPMKELDAYVAALDRYKAHAEAGRYTDSIVTRLAKARDAYATACTSSAGMKHAISQHSVMWQFLPRLAGRIRQHCIRGDVIDIAAVRAQLASLVVPEPCSAACSVRHAAPRSVFHALEGLCWKHPSVVNPRVPPTDADRRIVGRACMVACSRVPATALMAVLEVQEAYAGDVGVNDVFWMNKIPLTTLGTLSDSGCNRQDERAGTGPIQISNALYKQMTGGRLVEDARARSLKRNVVHPERRDWSARRLATAIATERLRSGDYPAAHGYTAAQATLRARRVLQDCVAAVYFDRRLRDARVQARLQKHRGIGRLIEVAFQASHRSTPSPPSACTFVMLGDGMSGGNLDGVRLAPGTSAPAHKQIYRRMEEYNILLALVDEHRTSTVCPMCQCYAPWVRHASPDADEHTPTSATTAANPPSRTRSAAATATHSTPGLATPGARGAAAHAAETRGARAVSKTQKSSTHQCRNSACTARRAGGQTSTTWSHDHVGFLNIARGDDDAHNGWVRPPGLSHFAAGKPPASQANSRRRRGAG